MMREATNGLPGLPPARPIMMKERQSMVFLRYGELDVLDGAFVLVDEKGVRTMIPVGSVACIMLETGTRVSHEAVKLAARVGCLLIWVGDGGVRLYAVGQPGGARSDRLLYQASLALDESARLRVVRKMYAIRFKEESPRNRSVEQLRGIEGARVKRLYEIIARSHGVVWNSRSYDQRDWTNADTANRCLSAATSCLYGVCEAAILAAGYSPAIGFIHTGKPQSFVYDIADIVKFDSVVPIAFSTAAKKPQNPEAAVRHACRDSFRKAHTLSTIIPMIETVLEAGELQKPNVATPESVAMAIPNKETIGDAGHR